MPEPTHLPCHFERADWKNARGSEEMMPEHIGDLWICPHCLPTNGIRHLIRQIDRNGRAANLTRAKSERCGKELLVRDKENPVILFEFFLTVSDRPAWAAQKIGPQFFWALLPQIYETEKLFQTYGKFISLVVAVQSSGLKRTAILFRPPSKVNGKLTDRDKFM